MIVVETAIGFREFDRFDTLLHIMQGDIALLHLECGGDVAVTPQPYRKGLLGTLVPVATTEHRMECQECGTSVGPYDRAVLDRSLRQFLIGPDWQTAPAQHLDELAWFVPPQWPPRRRKLPDRRKPRDRYSVDRSMEGRRRRGRDRRSDPTERDF